MMIPLAIDWRLDTNEIIVSEKDLILPSFDEIDWEFLNF
jgi:dTDP-4-dehydrorhamnose 3,5-epimerase